MKGCLLLKFRRQALELSEQRLEEEWTEKENEETAKTDQGLTDTKRILELLEAWAKMNGVKGGAGDGGNDDSELIT